MHSVQARYALLGPKLDLLENIELILNDQNVIIEINELDRDIPDHSILIPGLFNTHVHSADIGLRGLYLTDLATMVGPGGTKHRYLANLSQKQLNEEIKRAYNEAVHYGTMGWSDFREGGIQGLDPYPLDDTGTFLPFARPQIDEIPLEEDDLNIGIRDVKAYSPQILHKLDRYVQLQGSKIFIHASEDAALREEWITEYGKSDIVWILEQLDINAIVHSTLADDNDLMKMRHHEVGAVLCVTSNQKTVGKTPPLDKIINFGLKWGIGTDNAMFNPLSIWYEMKSYRQFSIPPRKLLTAATVGGAELCGLNWGIEKGNSNFLRIMLSESNKNLYEWLAFDCSEQFIEQIYQGPVSKSR